MNSDRVQISDEDRSLICTLMNKGMIRQLMGQCNITLVELQNIRNKIEVSGCNLNNFTKEELVALRKIGSYVESRMSVLLLSIKQSR